MSPGTWRKHRTRTRMRHRRAMKQALFTVGLAALAAGVGLLAVAHFSGNLKFRRLALYYVIFSAVILGFRQVVVEWQLFRRRGLRAGADVSSGRKRHRGP